MKNKVSSSRLMSIVGMVFITLLLSIFVCAYENFYADEIICIFFMDIMFLLAFIYSIEYERVKDGLLGNRNTRYFKILAAYTVSAVLAGGCVFVPGYFKPIYIFPLIMAGVCNNSTVVFSVGLYFDIIISMSTGCTFYQLVGYCFLTMIGAILSKPLLEKKQIKYVAIMSFAANASIPFLLSYWNFKEADSKYLLYALLDGVIAVIGVLICSKIFKSESEDEIGNILLDIISVDYPLAKEMKELSYGNFLHADIVSGIAYKCGKIAGVDEKLCAAAGYYYRLGLFFGEPHVESGVNKADEHCFPIPLIRILEEYNAEEKLPSTPESAIVFIVDTVVKKLETVMTEVPDNQWNKDLIIYQNLNELSSAGVLDKSGLTMNQFLKVREFLAREDII